MLKITSDYKGLRYTRFSFFFSVSHNAPRVGMFQDLVELGADLPAVMQAGRWKTSCIPARYTEHQAANRNGVAQFFGK